MDNFNNLFVLMHNLSHYSDKRKVIELYIEGMGKIFHGTGFQYFADRSHPSPVQIEITTKKSDFGVINVDLPKGEKENYHQMISNSVAMLALILEHIDLEAIFDKAIDINNISSGIKIDRLGEIVSDLKEARTASINLIEDLSEEIEKRKKAEESIRKAELYYRSLIEKAPDGIVLIDEKGDMVYASPSARKIFGYDGPDDGFPNPNSNTHPDDLPMVMKTIDSMIHDPKLIVTLEYRFKKKDGNYNWVESTFSNQWGEKGLNALVINFRDITDRKNAADKINLLSSQNEAILASVPNIIMEVDNNQVYTWANTAGYDFFGKDVLGKNAAFYIEEGQDTLIKAQDLFNGQSDKSYIESRQRRADGEIRLLSWWCKALRDTNGNISGALSSATDITDIRKNAEALVESEKKFRNLFENSPLGKSMTGVDGTLNVNKAFCNMLGYTEEELKSANWRDISHPDDIPNTDKIVQSLLEGKTDLARFEKRYIHKNGSTIYTEIASYLQKDNEGKPKFFITSVNDITERKRHEAERLQLHEVIDKSQNEIYIFNTSDLKFEYVNHGALTNLGYSREEMMTMTPVDIKPEFTLTGFKNFLKPLLSGKKNSLVFETIHQRKNGSTYPVDIYLQLQQNSEKGLFLAVINDITERKKVEEILQANYSLIKTAGRLAKFGGWNVILSENRSYWSDEVAEIHEMPHGYFPKVEEGINFYAPESRETISKVFMNCAKNGVPYDEKLVIITSTGKRVWVRTIGEAVRDENGIIFKVQGFFQDISEQKKAEDVLRESEEKYRSLVEVSQDSIFINKDDKIVYLNGAALKLFGANNFSDVIGKSPFDFFHPDDHEIIAKRIYNMLTIDAPVPLIEERIVRIDGGIVDVEVAAAPFSYQGDRAIQVVLRDITRRKKIEQEIYNFNRELEHRVLERTEQFQAANKELEAFSYSVSHDLRAPLRAIHSFSKILMEDYEKVLDAEGRRVCKIIESSSVHMGQLIDDLLAFSRIGRTELILSKIDMTKLSKSVFFGLTTPDERAKIDFVLDKLPSAYGDPTTIEQVMVNLISNALKYSSKTEKPRIIIGSEKDGKDPIYYVKDNGVGFDSKYTHKLFGVFQRLHSSKEFEGNGVGLAIVQRIVHRHGGRILAEGEPGKGAKFSFTLSDGKK